MPSKHESKIDHVRDQFEDTEATLAKLRQKEMATRAAARKRETQVKIELGGLVRKAGLDRYDTATILGVMMLAVDRLGRGTHDDLRLLLQTTNAGIAAFAGDSKESDASRKPETPEPVAVTFDGEPGEVAEILLRALRFRHDPGTYIYQGRATRAELEAYLLRHGARLVDQRPRPASETTASALNDGVPDNGDPAEHVQVPYPI